LVRVAITVVFRGVRIYPRFVQVTDLEHGRK